MCALRRLLACLAVTLLSAFSAAATVDSIDTYSLSAQAQAVALLTLVVLYGRGRWAEQRRVEAA